MYLFLLLIGCILTDTVSTKALQYHIVPANSTGQCSKFPNSTCFTLNQLAGAICTNNCGNVSIKFLAGEHSLIWNMRITDSDQVSLLSTDNDSGSFIECDGTKNTGFDFTNLRGLVFSGLSVLGCKREHLTGGGALFIRNVSNVFVSNSQFLGNAVIGVNNFGGAVYMEDAPEISVNYSIFGNNSAACHHCVGGALVIVQQGRGRITIHNCSFEFNEAGAMGGALALYNMSYSTRHNVISDTIFKCNSARVTSLDITSSIENRGGALIVTGGALTISFSLFVNNTSQGSGGAVYLDGSKRLSLYNYLYSETCHYISNEAMQGGALYTYLYSISTGASRYFGNFAHILGGAIFFHGTYLKSTRNEYTSNKVVLQGGAVYMNVSNATSSFLHDSFSRNTGEMGAAIYKHQPRKVLIISCQFIANSIITKNKAHDENGIICVVLAVFKFSGKIVFSGNQGSIYSAGSQITFTTAKIIMENNQGYGKVSIGGALTFIQSQVTFHDYSLILLRNNTATYGGAMYVSQSTVKMLGKQQIIGNDAKFGGGIYAYQSSIEIGKDPSAADQTERLSEVSSNTATEDGGGVYLTGSTMKISNYVGVCVYANRARQGGGFFLEQASRIAILKYSIELNTNHNFKISLHFIGNLASSHGGAIFVADVSNIGVLCEGTSSKVLDTAQCFLQSVAFYENIGIPAATQINFVNVFFTNNTANSSGGDIYGGLLDRCGVSPLAELIKVNSTYGSHLNGLTYLNTIAVFNNDDAENSDGTITSDPTQVCFCSSDLPNCTMSHDTIHVQRGEKFQLSVFAVDQVGRPLNATIVASYVSKGGIGRLKEGQETQTIGNVCSELSYNVFSTGPEAKIQLYADGPCKNSGISKREVNITFLPCTCPVGFEPSTLPIESTCECVCDKRLSPYVSNCTYENASVVILKNVWIHFTNSTNDTGFIIHTCPPDYCRPLPSHTNLNDSDLQCASNRMGTICGACTSGHSMVFGSTRCKICSNYFLLLSIPFALAGVALVSLILMLNLTVALGTINGLIFYANIVAANRSIFLPYDRPNFVTVFISWLNLDVGFEVCFYNGMDSYGKVLLQLVFPVYLFALVGIIIALAEYSTRFAWFIGHRNPVATLSTLILLSYSKLIRFTITALRFDLIWHPDGFKTVAWSYDASIPYFIASHAPRFVSALLILTLGGVYTVLVLFDQWFSKCSNRRLCKWIGQAQYNTFIRAYNAPLLSKHRYWFGLLLLVRIIHSIVSAFAADSVVILLVGVLGLSILTWKLLQSRIYEKWLIDTLETLFLVNLVILSISTYFVTEARQSQQALAYTSVSLSFVTFLCVFIYHLATYVFKVNWSKAERKVMHFLNRIRDGFCARQQYTLVPTEEEEEEEIEGTAEGEELDLFTTYPPFGYTGDPTDEHRTQPRQLYDPPVIQSCVPVDRLREPDLDILAPVSQEDYDIRPARRRRPPTPVTYSEINVD